MFDGSTAALLLTSLLAGQGANVSRVTGSWSPHQDGHVDWIPHHRLVSLDASSQDSREAVSNAVAAADLVIDATDTGEMVSWGYGYHDALRLQSRVIYCLLPAFPASAFPGGGDLVVSAALGLWSNAEGLPVSEPLPVASAYGAMMAAYWLAVTLAAAPADSGIYLETPLFNAGLLALGRHMVTLNDPRLIDPISSPRLPIAEIYECADGKHVQLHGADPHFVNAITNVWRPDWAADAVAALDGLPDYADVARWRARLAKLVRRLPSDQWENGIAAGGGACTPCLTRTEWLNNPQAIQSGIIVKESNAAGREVRRVGAPVVVTSATDTDPASAETGPLRKLATQVSQLRVLDLCIVLAGPTCGRFLSDGGATVLKVDDPRRPVSSPYGWIEVNRGKRSILIDLRLEEGKAVLWRLLEDADVILENYRYGKLEILGFGYEQVAQRFPHIIYGSFNAFDYGGSWERRPGWEQNAEAATGMQVAREVNGRPKPVPFPVNDYGTGLLGAYGIVAALLERNRTGLGQRVTGSLSRTASFIQSAWLSGTGQDYGALPTGDACLYACRDGWLVADGALRAPELRSAVRAEDVAEESCAEVLQRLRAAGFTAARIADPDLMVNSAVLRQAGLVIDWQHDAWGLVTQTVPGPSVCSDFVGARWPAPDPGQHTAEVLAEIGVDDADLSRLLSMGAVVGRMPLFADPESE